MTNGNTLRHLVHSTNNVLVSQRQIPYDPTQIVGSKRKAHGELEQPSKRSKAAPSNDTLADTQGRSPPQTENATGRCVSRGLRKGTRANGYTLLRKPSGVKKPRPSKQASRRSKNARAAAGVRERANSQNNKIEPGLAQKSSTQDSVNNGKASRDAEKTAASRGKKRSAPNDGKVGDTTKRQKVDSSQEPKGLVNHRNACFANAVIQLIDVALDGHDIDALLGKADDVETFGLTNEDIAKFDNGRHASRMPVALKKQETELRSAIKATARNGEVGKLSAAKHLRKVIEDLHDQGEGSESVAVSPYLLQSVLAWGDAEDAFSISDDLSSREKMSGNTQEDALEYFQLLLDSLAEDPYTADPGSFTRLFEIETETTRSCDELQCNFSKTQPKAVHNYHNTDVPPTAKQGRQQSNEPKPTLASLLNESLTSVTDDSCVEEGCKSGQIRSNTTLTRIPDDFLVRLNRTTFAGGFASKTQTVIELDNTLDLLDSQYALRAVIMHRGRINRGHYTAFRKEKGQWYWLDDKQCTAEIPTDGSRKRGHAVMALYQKV